jgi:hypothetical protein
MCDGAPAVTRIDLDTEAHVPGVEEQQFRGHADQAKANCPVSRALAGVPEIALTAKPIWPARSTNGMSILPTHSTNGMSILVLVL